MLLHNSVPSKTALSEPFLHFHTQLSVLEINQPFSCSTTVTDVKNILLCRVTIFLFRLHQMHDNLMDDQPFVFPFIAK